jgi:hypothetical protein
VLALAAALMIAAAPAYATPTPRRTISGETSDYLVVVLTDASVVEY